jgi:hypothetical protein
MKIKQLNLKHQNKNMLESISKLLFTALLLTAVSISQAQNTIMRDTILTSDSYLYERTDFEIDIASAFANPYDANEIALDMVITSPSAKSLVLACFYVSGTSTASIWNARFAAQETGTYSYHFSLSKLGVSVATSTEKQFNVNSSAGNGIIHKNSNWTFTYDSGKPFRGIGENIGWEARSYENQKYRYDYFLPKLAENGVNFFRTWICSWNLPLEWKTVKDTKLYTNSSKYFNPGAITRMDQLVDLCDSLDMHMMLALIPHGALITSSEWNINNYNVANGGPAKTPTEFFTLAASKAKFKNQLRYLVARWGYSPAIGVWEFFNEIDNAAYNGGTTLVIPEAAITQWHTEMSAYLKSIDIYKHLISTSTSHRDIAGMNGVANIDFNQSHIYNNTKAITTKIPQYETTWEKPYVIGEFGYDWDWNNVNEANAANFIYDLKRGLWYGLFTSTPILPMTWWWEFFDQHEMTGYYKSVTDVSKQMLLAGNGTFEPATVGAGTLEKFAIKCGQKYYFYLLNGGTTTSTATVSLKVSANTEYTIKTLEPTTNQTTTLSNKTAASGSLNLGSLSLPSKTEIVYLIAPVSDQSGVQLPYSGNATVLPGRLEAENFDRGGEGVAFHDFEVSNIPGKYRPLEAVDIDTTGDGSYCVSEIVKGEWLRYSVNVETEGTYSLEVRVAATEAGKSFRIILDNQDMTGIVQVPNTGGLQNWQVLSVPLKVASLLKGTKTIEIQSNSSSFNLDYLSFKILNQAPKVSLTSPENTGSFITGTILNIAATAIDVDGSIAKVSYYNGSVKLGEVATPPYQIQWQAVTGNLNLTAVATDDKGLTATSEMISGKVAPEQLFPGTIQAEDYDIGVEGVAFHELSAGNKFGFYRNDNVDLEQCTDTGGGYSLGDFQTGEWTQYIVNVSESGTYSIDLRVATQMAGTSLAILIDDKNVTGTISIPNTGGWQTWTTITKTGIQISKGSHKIKLLSVAQYVNVNYMTFSLSTGVSDIQRKEIICYPNLVKSKLWFENISSPIHKVLAVNILGVVSSMNMDSDHSVDLSSFSPGFYMVSLISARNEVVQNFKIIKE